MIATVFFLIVLISGVYIRDLQHISVASIIESLGSQGVGYGKLLSNDKTAQLTVDNDNSINSGSTSSSSGTSGSFSVNTNSPASSGNHSGSGGGGGSARFTAAIVSFEQPTVTLQCSKPLAKLKNLLKNLLKARWCNKEYTFSSGVRSQNGPGTISYGWRSTIASATQDGSISVGGGTVLTTLQKTITLPCDQPTNFTLQFVILTPNLTRSSVKNINHNCNEL
jgi:hypothetical protein